MINPNQQVQAIARLWRAQPDPIRSAMENKEEKRVDTYTVIVYNAKHD